MTPQRTKSIQKTVHPDVKPEYNDWMKEIHMYRDKSEPFHVPEDQERPYVEWSKNDEYGVNYVLWTGIVLLAIAVVAWGIEIF